MSKTKIGCNVSGSKVKKQDRLCDTLDISLRDLIVKDLLTDSEIKMYYKKNKAEMLDKFNIYIDKYEEDPSVVFNLSIDGKPASETCFKYEIVTISGNSNESGADPLFSDGEIVEPLPDTIVKFTMPIDPSLNSFSQHTDGKSYANYVIYGIKKGTSKSRIMLCKGKIYMTDVLFDLTENILDGQ